MASKPKSQPLTIVIKLGTSSIVTPTYPFPLHLQLLSSIVETTVKLRELGHRVVIVSSGAIGVGMKHMRLKERGKGLHRKQALAAIGQGKLITLWDQLFSQLDQPIAQILLTRQDISDRTRYLNAQNTFSELLSMGVVPIVNENDTVSVSEIKFGDNDTLSAISSSIVHADFLFLLTDVECLYTDNPRSNPDAKPVRVVRDIEKVKRQVSTATLGTSLGTGGMSTKLIAAELATAAGVTTVIMHSEKVNDIFEVIEEGVGPSREVSETPRLEEGPLCTRFLRRESAMNDRKWWIAHGLHTAGTVVVDEGAYRAITNKESGGRLLPAGVLRVEGVFASHQGVRLVVKRRRKDTKHQKTLTDASLASIDEQSPTTADGPSSLVSPSLKHLQPTSSASAISPISSPETQPQPNTPHINPAASMSSSVASLEPLSPAVKAISERLSATTMNSSLGQELKVVQENQTLAADQERQRLLDVGDEWEEVEVGKGLSHYNSSEIDRIKGMKSSSIEQLLGYCESEHVVDSITLFV